VAIIDGKPPEPARQEAGVSRVVVRLREGVDLPSGESALGERTAEGWDEIAHGRPGLRFSRYISSLADEQEEPNRIQAGGRGRSGASDARLALGRYFVAEVANKREAESLAEALGALDDVESAYVEAGPTPPPSVVPADDPRSTNQGYLDAAPDGIDARWAWTFTNGVGVGFVDVEQGWTLDHEDLVAAHIKLISGVNKAYTGHGTAVLGEVVAVDNKLGGIGIAPYASTRVVSQYRTATLYNTADAVLAATKEMSAGDVLLLEAQTSYANLAGPFPVEVEDAVFDAIRAAVDDDIIVLEAGGNGSVDLDAFTSTSGKQILNRSSADFRDSGAIMVGAASAAPPHRRLWFSNFGSRIDSFAWGESIDTCGDGWTGTSKNAYTSLFGGTSGATPIVTGAAILLQSFGRARGRPYTPAQMRAWLADTSLNTHSDSPADRIGVMPDLRAIIEYEQLHTRFNPDRWKLVAQILFGVDNDGGGVVIVPGQGPVPVGPWGPLMMESISTEVRDVLAALAVHELAALSTDEASVRAIRKASVSSVRRAIDQLAAKTTLR
jgi:subtilase family protein